MGGKVKMASCCVCAPFNSSLATAFYRGQKNGMFASAMGFVFLNQIVRRVLKLWDTKIGC